MVLEPGEGSEPTNIVGSSRIFIRLFSAASISDEPHSSSNVKVPHIILDMPPLDQFMGDGRGNRVKT